MKEYSMKHSLFRRRDYVELSLLYIICFSVNTALSIAQTLNLERYPVFKSFIENILDVKLIVIVFSTLIVLIFQYQFVRQRKIEILCRILVGDTRQQIAFRYMLHHLLILCCCFMFSLVLHMSLQIHIASSLLLVFIFVFYIILFTSWVNQK